MSRCAIRYAVRNVTTSSLLVSLAPLSNAIFVFIFFFFNDTATTEIYTLSLHDALPISFAIPGNAARRSPPPPKKRGSRKRRSEEHTSELQSPCNLVCRLLLEKKKNNL